VVIKISAVPGACVIPDVIIPFESKMTGASIATV
jgi:hypothetical protein